MCKKITYGRKHESIYSLITHTSKFVEHEVVYCVYITNLRIDGIKPHNYEKQRQELYKGTYFWKVTPSGFENIQQERPKP